MRTEQQILAEAYEMQSITDLSEVAFCFSCAIMHMREVGIYNPDHPICRLYADRIATLTKIKYAKFEAITDAYELAPKAHEALNTPHVERLDEIREPSGHSLGPLGQQEI